MFRSGADSFVVTLPGCDLAQANGLARMLVRAVSSAEGPVNVTACAGVAGVDDTIRDGDDLRDALASALASARALGRAQVATAGPERLVARARPGDEGSFLAIAHGLVAANEDRAAWLEGHGERVAHTAGRLSVLAGMDAAGIASMRLAGRLHDLGKIAVPDRILDKPAELDPEEQRQLQEHPVLAARMLAPAGDADLIAWVGDHHERFDGSGYPVGLSGNGISLGGRILALADAWENLLVRQPTRRALSRAEAVERITAESGVLWDPVLAELLLWDVAPVRKPRAGGPQGRQAGAANGQAGPATGASGPGPSVLEPEG